MSDLTPCVHLGVQRCPLVRVKWKRSVRQTACPPTASFHRRPCRRRSSWPHRHTRSLPRRHTHTHTHVIAHCRVLWGALWSPKAQPTAHAAVTHLWICPSALPASPSCPNTHMNTVIGRPHVPVNLLMRRHGLRRVPLPPRGWPDLSACQFYSLPRWLLDGLPHLID